MAEAQVFRYPRSHWAYTVLGWLALIGIFGYFGAIRGGSSIWLAVPALWIMVSIAGILRMPVGIAVRAKTVVAMFLFRKPVEWSRSDLRVAGTIRHRWQLTVQSGFDVFDRVGNKAFRLDPNVQDFEILFDLLAPGVRASLDAKAAKSWWSRNLV
jgi:hypothetical protein